MAIPRIRAVKIEHSKESRTHLGIAGGLLLMSVIFLWLGVSRIAYRSNIVAALQAADRNHVGNIDAAIEGALKWNPSSPVPRLLMAKRLVDEDSYARAEELYKKLLEEPGPHVAQAQVGLGVIALRK